MATKKVNPFAARAKALQEAKTAGKPMPKGKPVGKGMKGG